MADQEFKPGDVVRLKSGGPKMTIAFKYVNDDNNYMCTWWVETTSQFGEKSFEGATLVKVGNSSGGGGTIIS